jgi:hypothetical protein
MLISSPFTLISYESPQNHSPIILTQTSTWTHAGPHLTSTSLPPNFHAWHRKTILSGNLVPIFTQFLDFLYGYLRDKEMTHYTLSIRAQKATDEYDIPRWHFDPGAFGGDVGFAPSQTRKQVSKWSRLNPLARKEGELRELSTIKIATVLQGPGTLFLKDSERGRDLMSEIQAEVKASRVKDAEEGEHTCFPLRCLGCAETASAVRFKLAEKVEELNLEVTQMQIGEAAIFRAEDKERKYVPAMHSEPKITGDRVFVHVIPGTEEEVKRLVEGWGMSFPRSWSVGLWGDDLEVVDEKLG